MSINEHDPDNVPEELMGEQGMYPTTAWNGGDLATYRLFAGNGTYSDNLGKPEPHPRFAPPPKKLTPEEQEEKRIQSELSRINRGVIGARSEH